VVENKIKSNHDVSVFNFNHWHIFATTVPTLYGRRHNSDYYDVQYVKHAISTGNKVRQYRYIFLNRPTERLPVKM
jgi:hypothetical protein